MKSNNQGVNEETFIQTSRRGQGWAIEAERTRGKAVAGGLSRQGSNWWTGWSHICVQINWQEQLGSKTDYATQGSSTWQ